MAVSYSHVLVVGLPGTLGVLEAWHAHGLRPTFASTLASAATTRHPDPVDVVVIGAFAARRDAAFANALILHRRYPGVPIVAVISASTGLGERASTLVRIGYDAVAVDGYDSIAQSAARALQAVQQLPLPVAASAIREGLFARATIALAPIVDAIDSRMPYGVNVEDLARQVGIGRRALHQRLIAANGPPPFLLISLCRLTIALPLLRDPNYSQALIARRLGFSSARQLRALIRRNLGTSPRGASQLTDTEVVARLSATFSAAERPMLSLANAPRPT